MARKRKRWTPEERAEWEAARDRTQAMVRERIAYHDAKAREEDDRRATRRDDA